MNRPGVGQLPPWTAPACETSRETDVATDPETATAKDTDEQGFLRPVLEASRARSRSTGVRASGV